MVKAFVGDRAVVVAVPVPTPAGGLVRVIGSTGEQLLDSSYPAGTAACSLLEKMKWKLGDPDTRGPPPFKKPPAVAWPEKLAAVLTSLEAEGFSPPGEGVPSFEEAVAVREAELAALEKTSGAKQEMMDALVAALAPVHKQLREELTEADAQAVEVATGQAKEALGL